MLPFDLHVLSIPPAFNLSQDQTLQFSFLTMQSIPSFIINSTSCQSLFVTQCTTNNYRLILNRISEVIYIVCFFNLKSKQTTQIPTQITLSCFKILKSQNNIQTN